MKFLNFALSLLLGLAGVLIVGSLIGAGAGLICYAIAYYLEGFYGT